MKKNKVGIPGEDRTLSALPVIGKTVLWYIGDFWGEVYSAKVLGYTVTTNADNEVILERVQFAWGNKDGIDVFETEEDAKCELICRLKRHISNNTANNKQLRRILKRLEEGG